MTDLSLFLYKACVLIPTSMLTCSIAIHSFAFLWLADPWMGKWCGNFVVVKCLEIGYSLLCHYFGKCFPRQEDGLCSMGTTILLSHVVKVYDPHCISKMWQTGVYILQS